MGLPRWRLNPIIILALTHKPMYEDDKSKTESIKT